MKSLLLASYLFAYSISYAQNVNLEIIDFVQKLDGREFSIYQFARSSYSSSRSSVILIIPKRQFLDLTRIIPELFKRKQEYTDVWILGFDIIDRTKLSDIELKVVDKYFNRIVKYRIDNDLPPYDLKRLSEQVIFLNNYKEICNNLMCPKSFNW